MPTGRQLDRAIGDASRPARAARPLGRASPAWLLALAGLIGCGGEATPPPDAPPLPAESWALATTPDDLARRPVQIEEFEIRPPDELQSLDKKKPGSYVWFGPIRPDETYVMLTVSMTDIPAESADTSLEQLFEWMLPQIGQERAYWKSTGMERGKLNGHPFIRTHYSGPARSDAREGLKDRTMHGAMYVGKFDRRLVCIMFQDVAPDHVESLKLAERAVATFRLAPPVASP